MDLADIHETAAAILRAAGYDEDEAPGARAVAIGALGPGSVLRVPCLRRPAALEYVGGRPVILLRSRLSAEHANFLIAHELAEWWLTCEGDQGERIEEAADAIAAALVAPRLAFARAVREHGHDYPTLAALFCATESLIVLRIGEVTGEPIALVAPHRVRARGEAYEWPTEPELRRVAKTDRPPPPGLARCRLTDDARRVALHGFGASWPVVPRPA